MMKDLVTDLQLYLSKFSGSGSLNVGKAQVPTGDSNIDPIKVMHGTILGVCHFQSLEGTNIKTNISQSSEVFERNLSPSELNVIVVDEFKETLI